MYKLDKEKAREILVEEEDFTPYKVDTLLEDYPSLSDELGEAVDQWLEDRSVNDEINVEGFTIREVMNNRQIHFLVAIKKLNNLLDEKLPDEDRKKQKEILGRKVTFK